MVWGGKWLWGGNDQTPERIITFSSAKITKRYDAVIQPTLIN